MNSVRARIDAAIKEQLSEVDRLQHVAAIDLPVAQKRLKKLEALRDRVSTTKDLDELITVLCDERIVSVR